MELKKIKIIVIFTLISLITAGIVHSIYTKQTLEITEGEKLLPKFKNYANNVTDLQLQGGGIIFTIKKAKYGEWKLIERGSYPVSRKRVEKLFSQIAKAELIEAKTNNPKLHSFLQLEDPEKKNTTAKRIKLMDQSGLTLSELVIGKLRFNAFGRNKSGTYVRLAGDTQTWLAYPAIQFELLVSDWVDPYFFKITADEITSITLIPPDGQIIKIVSEVANNSLPSDETDKDNKEYTGNELKKPKFRFINIPEGKKLKERINAFEIVRVLETLELKDVRKSKIIKDKENSSVFTASIETNNSLLLKLNLLKSENSDYWLSAEIIKNGNDLEYANKLRKELEGWHFKIANWSADQFFIHKKDIFEDVSSNISK
ncbi:MAG: DUF4340 domain-containing protein [Hyphomicrobiaceae bacterium]|nr:DUF4340 domain-containing protein [Hyphomicrobiaceae bacterium]